MADFLTALNKNGSGLNLRDLATSLVQADIVPKERAEQARMDRADTSLSALGRVRAQMQQLSVAMQSVAQTPVLKASSSSSSVSVTVRDAAKIAGGTRAIGVVQTAQRQVLEFSGHASADAPIGGGRLTVDTGVWTTDPDTGLPDFAARPDAAPQTITLDATATLSDLAEALDALEGVSAAVVDKGDGTFSLGVVSETGAASALRFAVTDATGGLGAFDTQAGTAGAEVAAARDAVLTVDGIAVMRPTNTIDDLLAGVRLEIGAPTGSPATVSLTRDADTARDNLSFLVEQVNATRALLTELGARGLNGAEPGALAGDRLVETLKAQLDRLVSAPVAGFGATGPRLSDFGVETQRDGTLRLDKARFDAAFARDPARIEMLFDDRITSPQDGVSLSGTPAREAEARTYRFARDTSGRATLDGTTVFGISMGDGTRKYILSSGGLAGTVLTVPEDTTEAEINLGRSLAGSLQTLAAAATDAGGVIGKRETVLEATLRDAEGRLTALEVKSAALEKRYLSRFAAMEQAITSMKGTGAYLTNLVAQWNKDS
jgi:flagellar hook-associated protein 2